ncbi:MAG TPA: bifunctional glycosyltransferase family 2/GtrA family protein [Patescibacteria group bacterium]
MKNLSLSVFFPAYNEETNIESSVSRAREVLQQITSLYEIIIINDGSSDATGAIADRLAKKYPNVRVVHHPGNRGYGEAVKSGFAAARYDYVFFTDADLQFDLTEIKKLIQYIPEYQVVIGYRAKRRDPFLRTLNAKGWNLLNRLTFGLKVKDIDCAFKLFDRTVIKNIHLQSGGAMVSAELLIRLQRQGTIFKEVPVTHIPRAAGSPTGAKPSVILRAFKEMIIAYRGDLGNVTQRQAIKFMTVGFANTCLDLLLYFIFSRYISFFVNHRVIAKMATYGIASLSSFIFNRRWTFRRTSTIHMSEVIRFYVTVGFALIINAGTMYILIGLKVNDIIAAPIATLVSFVWNFLVSKFWVFTHKKG